MAIGLGTSKYGITVKIITGPESSMDGARLGRTPLTSDYPKLLAPFIRLTGE